MAVNPFRSIPRTKFQLRALPVGLFSFFLGVSFLGMAGVGPGWAFEKDVIYRLLHIAEPCLSGNTISDFQARQCDQFFAKLWTDCALAGAPLLLAVIAFFVTSDQLSLVYRRARKRIEAGQAVFKGTVTNPPTLPKDSFAWFHCLNVFSLELPNKAQVKVYVPEDAPQPRPGEQLAVFEGGKIFGTKRYFGVLYAPHLAIVRGGIAD